MFGGSAAILLKKHRSEIEVYNDLDSEIVNLLKVARDRADELAQKLNLTPYARDEFKTSFIPSRDPLEQARRTIVRSFQGYGGAHTAATTTKGSKTTPNSFRIVYKHGNRPQVTWPDIPQNLFVINERLKGVVIENRDFRTIIKRYNFSDALIYADPPYLPETRDYGVDYRHEMSEQDHVELSELLHNHKGPVVISGYRSRLYEKLYKGWTCKEFTSRNVSNKKSIEVIWIKSLKNLPIQGELFDE